MEKLYTPEPWEASDRVIRNIAETVYEGRVICRIPDETLAPLGYANWDANARRIVACINACRSVSNEDLADDCVEKMKADRDALLIQRDELLAALKEVVYCSENFGKAYAGRDARDKAKALIKRIENA